MSKKPRVAFLGLGVMGASMARHIAAGGFPLAVYDVSAGALAKFADVDCRRATSPADAARDADVLVTMLPTTAVVREALFGADGADGAAAAMQRGALVVESSTGDAAAIPALADDLARHGLRLVDAPVGRSPRECAAGKALVMCGGADADVEEARPVLAAFADTIEHVGPLGSGIRLKLVNNYMAMLNMVVTAEALMFAAKLGLPRETAVRVMSTTSAGRGQLNTNFPRKVLAGDVTPDFPLWMGYKDIDLALQLANRVGAPLGLGGYARELFALAKSWGREHEDCTAMLLLLEDIARVDRDA